MAHFTRIFVVASLGALNAQAEVNFREQVQPVLEKACVRCHGVDKPKGGLRLDTHAGLLKGGDSGPVIVPGKTKSSELVRRITLPRGHDDLMPQEAEPLSGPHRKWLIEWVESGALWPDGVVLKARTREVPGLADRSFIPARAPSSIHEASDFIDQILARENAADSGVQPLVANIIGDLAFLRRTTIDLAGRIPNTDEIKDFENESPSLRREKLINRLLDEPRFAERWTIFFSDMLRIRSRADGGSQLLAYVNRSLAEGKPYDEMVRELISTNGRPDEKPAAGFVLSDRADPMAMAAATSQIFLGVRLGCAECHDHPFDDWRQKEFYQLAAFFGKTKRVERGRRVKRIYTTEVDETAVKWPPEREQPKTRTDVPPKFPFQLVSFKTKPHYVQRLEKIRSKGAVAKNSVAAELALDDLIDGFDVKKALVNSKRVSNILDESKAEARKADDGRSIYRDSDRRAQLAANITDPRNPYFARAFVNRVWAELIGRGFVEPLDNISSYNEIRHPQTLQFVAQEFIANGYSLRKLLKTIMLSQAYQRANLPAGTGVAELARAEEAFTATRSRRMLGEVLFDSIAVAGHITEQKWPEGANVREVIRQIRIPLAPPAELMAEGDPAMLAGMKPEMLPAPYSLEKGEKLDFDALLKPAKLKGGEKDEFSTEDVLAESKMEQERNQMKEEAAIEAARQARLRLLASGNAERFRLKTVSELVDDNPQFDSTFRLATPAPASHFLRVFGQPARDNLGDFREEAPSLRQELMLLNGKLTHEAARVGPMEPVHRLISGPKAQPDKAVELAYLEIFTRRPSKEETADAREVLASAETPAKGLADLRWAMLNSHEFRYLP